MELMEVFGGLGCLCYTRPDGVERSFDGRTLLTKTSDNLGEKSLRYRLGLLVQFLQYRNKLPSMGKRMRIQQAGQRQKISFPQGSTSQWTISKGQHPSKPKKVKPDDERKQGGVYIVELITTDAECAKSNRSNQVLSYAPAGLSKPQDLRHNVTRAADNSPRHPIVFKLMLSEGKCENQPTRSLARPHAISKQPVLTSFLYDCREK